jgi:hypothetical protein
MGDWFRSVTVLVMAFVGAIVVTLGLANVIVPGGGPDPQAAADGGDGVATPPPARQAITGIGGNLTVTGDVEGTLTLDREDTNERYALEGNDARIVFEDVPPIVVQLSWQGLEFFPEPSDCTITPGELDQQLGIGYADIRCEGLEDVRGGETIAVEGTVGVALTLVGESDLPETGGSLTVGDETWSFPDALLYNFPFNTGAGTDDFNMELVDVDRGTLRFRYDVQTHRLGLISVERDGEVSSLAAGACSLTMNELGRLTPSAAVVELTIDCPAAEVPGLGNVPITGTVIIQQVEF